MSLRLEMLQVARLAPNLLQEAADRVAEFLREQFNGDGGARDRAGKSDLYYTVFALEGLIALRRDPPLDRVRSYLDAFGDGAGLDLVHLTCLARCRAAMPKESVDTGLSSRLAERIASFRSADGGFGADAGGKTGTVYHAFLSVGALQDLGVPLSRPEDLARFVESLHLEDGAYANALDIPVGSTPTTAAAVTLLRQLGAGVPERAGAWLLERGGPKGGFHAVKGAPMPDLLSTATALHALSGMKVSFGHLKDGMLDFVDTLWTGRSFCGNWADDEPDGEYTYYALLSLGHLSLA